MTAWLQAMERERAGADEELRKERVIRKQQDEKMRDMDQRARSAGSQLAGSPDKRKVDMLEKQVAQLKQEKQREEMRRLEAESTLKTVERRAHDLESQLESQLQRMSHQMHHRGGGVDPNRVAQLEQQLYQSEERRRQEEKTRAIAEGKQRHLENQLKQQSPFKYAKLAKKGPPPHMPDISEGREMLIPVQGAPSGFMDPGMRSPSVPVCYFLLQCFAAYPWILACAAPWSLCAAVCCSMFGRAAARRRSCRASKGRLNEE